MLTGKPLLVFALEAHAAARFEALVAAFGCFDVGRDDTMEPVPSELPSSEQKIIIVTRHLPAWVDRLQKNADVYQALYLRPAAVRMLDFFNQVLPGESGELAYRRRSIRFLDALLSQYPAVSVEDLFDTASRASESIARLLTALTGVPVPATPKADIPQGSSYNASVAGVLVPEHSEDALAQASAPLFDVDAVHSLAAGAVGTLVLEGGWSRPERSHVWSEGNLAAMRLPVAPTGGPFRCQLRGFVVQGDFVVRAYVEGNQVGVVDKPRQQPRDILIDVPLTLTRDHRSGPVRLSLEFDGTVSPFEAGLGADRRKLGLALRSFRIYPVRPSVAQESRATRALSTLRQAGYDPLAANAHERSGVDGLARADAPTPRFYPSWRPGVCLLVVPSGFEDIRVPLRFCAAAHCELTVLVSDGPLPSDTLGVDADDPAVVPFTRTLEEALDALTRLQWQPDTIMLWDTKPGHAAMATIAARLRDPTGMTGMTSDLVLHTDDISTLDPLIALLPGYAEVVIAVDGAVLVRSRARAAH
jgi:hypothetical protein